MKMRIDKIKLENIRSYSSSDVEFGSGLILIEGDNGAGKSSLLSTMFSGLYLSDVLKYMNSDINLDSLVKKGEKEGLIDLEFSVNGDTYNVKWEIEITEESESERKASTGSCSMTGDNLEDSIEGVRDVRSKVKEILGMNSRSFVNSVYVQQGDIMSMVEADEEDRREIIDDLLGLRKLDEFVERMDIVRREFGSQKRTTKDMMEEKNRQLEEYNEISEIESSLHQYKSKKKNKKKKKNKIKDEINNMKDHVSQLRTEMSNISSKKSKYESLKNKKDQKISRIDELKSEIDNINSNISDLNSKIRNIDTEIDESIKDLDIKKHNVIEKKEKITLELDDIKSSVNKLSEVKIKNKQSQIDRLRSDVSEFSDDIKSLENDKENIKDEIESLESNNIEINNRIETLSKIMDKRMNKINTICDQLDIAFDDISNLRENIIPEVRENTIDRVAEINEELGYEKARSDIYEDLNKNNICPVCDQDHNQDIDYSDEVDKIQNRAEVIRDQNIYIDEIMKHIEKVNDIESKIQIKKAEKERINDKLESKEDKKQNIKSNIKDKREMIGSKNKEVSDLKDKINNFREKLDQKKDKKDELETKLERYTEIISKKETKSKLSDKKSSYVDNKENNKELKNELQKQLFEIKKDIKQIEDDVKDVNIDSKKDKKDELESKINSKENKLEDIDNQIIEIQGNIAQKEQERKHIKNLKSEYNNLKDDKIEASEKELEAEDMMDAYRRVKTRLREENIGLLNKYANEVFKSVYSNQVYKQLKIDKQYNIRLVTGNDIEIEPKDLSGGEKTILSLAIRAGVYKLLVERNSNTDTLPPFILDEPTTYLDNTHVSNIQEVIDKITSWNVPQVFVVSHNYDIIQNADESYSIEKSPKTESSKIKKN